MRTLVLVGLLLLTACSMRVDKEFLLFGVASCYYNGGVSMYLAVGHTNNAGTYGRVYCNNGAVFLIDKGSKAKAKAAQSKPEKEVI